MNYRLVAKLLSYITFLTGGTMIFSLPWAIPALNGKSKAFEFDGFFALIGSIVVSFVVGLSLRYFGRGASGDLYRKEAMAVVGLSWVLATFLGALPYQLSRTCLAPGEPMSVVDTWFEAQSGFSTTGATVLTQLEDPALVPRCILFWRSSTHFLGGLGIIVLFVAILGQGSAGKALMRSEMPGPSKEGSQARMQHTALVFAGIYLVLNAILTVILYFQMYSLPDSSPLFDAICHAFGTMATGGFSTYDTSIAHFHDPWIEITIVVFMILAGTNFTLLYFFLVLRKPAKLLEDIEWRTYALIIIVVTLLIVCFGYVHRDPLFYIEGDMWASLGSGLRQSLFQVVSIVTTTGYGSEADFDRWNSFGRGVLFLLMFVGGCAGSTGGGMKVIRHVLFLKILGLELEKAYHPSVVRPLRIGGEPIEDQDVRKNILLYFGLILVIFVFSWMFLVTFEPDDTWTTGGNAKSVEHKLIDSASGIAATLNNIGPGLGTVGAKQNYAHFSPVAKLLFTLLMMVGRLEVFTIVVLFLPGFWRAR